MSHVAAPAEAHMDVCGCRRRLTNERMRTTEMGSPIIRTETWTIRYIVIYRSPWTKRSVETMRIAA